MQQFNGIVQCGQTDNAVILHSALHILCPFLGTAVREVGVSTKLKGRPSMNKPLHAYFKGTHLVRPISKILCEMCCVNLFRCVGQ